MHIIYSDILHLEVISDHIVIPGPDIEVKCTGTPTAIPLTGATLQNRTGGYICASWSIMTLDPPSVGNNGSLSNSDCTTTPSNVLYPACELLWSGNACPHSNDPDDGSEYSCTGVYEPEILLSDPM
jgi:hypothetical protein